MVILVEYPYLPLLFSSQFQLSVLLDHEPINVVGIHNNQSKHGVLRRIYYGKLIWIGQRKRLINSFRLGDRTYLGNTSMDVRLAGLMANMGLCRKGSMVWDPFVGTGSILVAASIWGAMGAGSDINYALLHGIGMSPKAGQVSEHTVVRGLVCRSIYVDSVSAPVSPIAPAVGVCIFGHRFVNYTHYLE